MNAIERLRLALRLGSPVLAARILLEGGDPLVEHCRDTLRVGDWKLWLPSDAPELARLEELLEVTIGRLEPPSGVYCLAAHDWNGGRVGSVRFLSRPAVTSSEWSDFDAGCSHGHQAAAKWLLERYELARLGDAGQFAASPIPPLPSYGSRQQHVGDSAGVAAAIAYVMAQRGACDLRRLAATGRVVRGRIEPVDDLEPKLEAVLREAPFIRCIAIPKQNERDVSKALREVLEGRDVDLLAVESVPEVLERLFPDLGLEPLGRLAPEEAAKRAIAHEVHKEHGPAFALADALLRARDDWELERVDAAAVEAQARMIRAINYVHRGDAKRAETELDEAAALLTELPEHELHDLDFRARFAAVRASLLIDLLEAARAVEVCSAFEQDMAGVSLYAKIELLGSWTRAAAASGDFDEARKRSAAQRGLHPGRRHRHQVPQVLCNYLDVLFRCYEPGDQDTLKEIDSVLAEARAANDKLTDRVPREENDRYIGLWQTRRYALTGQADAALELAGDLPAGPIGGFPDHYRHRFAGEALARAGRVEEALERLEGARHTIGERCGDLERLILLTSGAAEACLRIEQDLDGWRPIAGAFFKELASWNDRFVREPAVDSPDAALHALRGVLRRLPY